MYIGTQGVHGSSFVIADVLNAYKWSCKHGTRGSFFGGINLFYLRRPHFISCDVSLELELQFTSEARAGTSNSAPTAEAINTAYGTSLLQDAGRRTPACNVSVSSPLSGMLMIVPSRRPQCLRTSSCPASHLQPTA